MVEEGLDVAHTGREGRRVAALARRLAVATGIPGIELEIGQVELVDQMRHAAAVLVPAMEQQDRAARRTGRHRPAAIE